MGWIWIWPVLILAGLLIAGYLVLRLTQGRASSSLGPSPARRILDERYARGEIDEEEYHRRQVELP